ncbi:hypothetical protein ANANG_G00072520 [Anguilla anguilla]|uniref:Sulfatase N-terminal domain-containing protein n=1 Tax=Anguilla anguilla TaxID=7936 RepID=A0A9D3S2U4_ANGAN|nr:hypothetical protein ANANG_G00072520 [Anguilla anguilla]
MAVHALTGFSVVSLLSFGYLSWNWTNPNQVEYEPVLDGKDKGSPLTPRKPPHIIFILTDDQGFHDVGYHGSDIRTPTLDKLAAEGVKLENYYIQPICTPSRSQLITGRYQIHTGLQHSIIRPRQPNCLPLDQVTLPQKLQEAGYATHMVGKWHLGFYKRECLPTRRGFDTYFGSLTGSVDYYTYDSCDGPGMCGYDLHEGEGVAWGRGGKYSTHLYTQRVRKILAAHDPRRPVFIFLSFQAVHTPLQSPKEYLHQYRDVANVARRRYAAMVSVVDEAVRNVTYALRKYGFYRDSVLVFSTDNGGQPFAGGSNWPLRGRKGTYWEGGIRGVGFVHSPLLRRRRRVSRALVHITDWYPTLVALAGATCRPATGWTGVHPLRRLEAADGRPGLRRLDPAADAGRLPGSWWDLERRTQAARKSVWLFNVTGDPYERYDQADQRPDVVRELLARLAHYNRTAIPVRYPAEDPRANPN